MISSSSPAASRRRPLFKKILLTLAILILVLAIAAAAFLFRPMASPAGKAAANDKPVDVLVIGGGIMGVTLATYLQEMEPDWRIDIYERMDKVAQESSNGWNNAGTGHSGFAELNYTPEKDDGSIATEKAVDIAEQFEISRQFWSHEVKQGRLPKPTDFINPTPHMSFVWGDDNIAYLHKRRDALVKNPLFYGMQYSQDPAQIRRWAPLVMEGRDPKQKVAATFMPLGTDVNFGVITTQLTHALTRNPNFNLQLGHEVRGLHQNADKTWNVTVHDLKKNSDAVVKAKFVFIGAGGASLKLLQMSGMTRPTLSWFAAAKPTGAAVLIIPGGGYSRVGIDREGYECARWMADMGIHAFVLRYRLPADRWAAGADVALQDAQRAMRLIRAGRSGGWTVDPQRVLVLGGSAGGHLAGSLCMRPNDRIYPMAESADHLSARPDGAILLYPVVTMAGATNGGSRRSLIGDDPTDAQIAAYSLDKIVASTTPPMILFHSVHDRTVPVDQSLTLFGAVRAAQGAIDMHLFDEGSHGVGLRGDPAQPFADWPVIARKWQVRSGLV